MREIKKPAKKKLITGFIYKDESLLNKIETILVKKLGPIDNRSPEFAFTHTEYYEKEMGKDLKRKFISFDRLVELERIWQIKLFTNRLEVKFSNNNKRTVNIDPGYLTLSKLVLLTTKDYVHRIYLGSSIFAEVTLFFKKGSFQPWEHTYQDYKTREHIEFFNSVRDIYKSQISL